MNTTTQNHQSKRTSLGTKFIVLTVLILAVTLSLTAILNVRAQNKLLVEYLASKGTMLGEFTASISPEAIFSYDFFTLDDYMRQITQQEDVVYGVIVSPKNANLTSYLDRRDLYIKEAIREATSDNVLQIISEVNAHSDIIPMSFPISGDQGHIGHVLIGLTTKRIHQLAQNALYEQLLVNGAIIIFLSICLYFVFRVEALHPIKKLICSSERIAKGDLEHHVTIDSNKELGCLADSFNSMTRALKSSQIEKDLALEQLKETNRNLEAATKAKSAFLANMSHEIRTPLTAIIGFGESLFDKDTSEIERTQATQVIIQNGKHLLSIINDILDLSKIEAEKLEIDLVNTSLFELLHDIETLVGMQASEKSLSFSINLTFPLPAQITTDPIRLKQILINLAGNAIKFTDVGKVDVNVSWDKNRHKIQYEVIDTGIGMSTEQQVNLFQPFTQADSSTTRQYGGTGLGLHLSRQLAEMLGGSIKVESQPGSGSRFILTIDAGPLEELDFVNVAPTVRAHLPPGKIEQSNKMLSGDILLAEDVLHNQQLISMYVRKTGANITIVENGKLALESIKNKQFDLVLLDMQMPVMDGITAVRKIRAMGYSHPVVALTANATKENKELCLREGCNDFLTKPIDRERLFQILEKYLKNTVSNRAESISLNQIEQPTETKEPDLRFLNRLPSIQGEIKTAVMSDNWSELQRLMHRLQSTSGKAGFSMLTNVADQILGFLAENNYQEATKSVIKFNSMCENIYSEYMPIYDSVMS
jgi:signal transduction histidine kinase/DNA-binding response OmpR family regulator